MRHELPVGEEKQEERRTSRGGEKEESLLYMLLLCYNNSIPSPCRLSTFANFIFGTQYLSSNLLKKMFGLESLFLGK